MFPSKQTFLLIFSILIVSFTSCEQYNSTNEQKKTIQGVEQVKNEGYPQSEVVKDETYQSYIDFFEEIYKTMDQNYYKPIDRSEFDRFIHVFDTKIYGELRRHGKSLDYIRWRSADKMINFLKDPEDVFSAFYPPKPAKEYEQTALGKRIDLGIEGKRIDQGFMTTQVEPRADAYRKGLRINDLIVRINEQDIKDLEEADINELLTPLEEETVTIDYLSAADRKARTIEVAPEEYFKQVVFEIPIPVEGIYGIELRRFNRKTSEDMLRFLMAFKQRGPMKGLIIDLRGNPGGPPLAAREIASFFLPPGEEFAYFQKKGQSKAMLDVPAIPEQFHYRGPMVILIDEGSGSASELFSGILQKRKRAVLIGKNSAGQVMLKSMFHLKDESMILLITARGHHPDGDVFSFDGLNPDRSVEKDDQENILKYAASYLLYMDNEQNP